MKLKWLFLFFILGFPVSIYIFLQGFGENKFEVQVYYETGIDEPIGECSQVSGQFEVPGYQDFDTTFDTNTEGIVVYDPGTPNCDSCQYKINNLLSLSDKFKEWNDFKIVSLVQGDQTGLYPDSDGNWNVVTSKGKLIEFVNCGLNLEIPSISDNRITKNGVVVLVDRMKRIRGYYNVFDRKESDRLAVELEILRIGN
ncbi:hypothetical protein [Reichenbachiella sp. MALMAid0571]|uniref:hypothetical protein n=1 Tax=Reichenbachiella sp. MALMAid0571 TaxID=3143939 RepID=UPI0032DFC311